MIFDSVDESICVIYEAHIFRFFLLRLALLIVVGRIQIAFESNFQLEILFKRFWYESWAWNHEHAYTLHMVNVNGSFIEMFISSIKFHVNEYHRMVTSNKISIYPLNNFLYSSHSNSFELHIYSISFAYSNVRLILLYQFISMPFISLSFDFLLCLCAESSFSFKWTKILFHKIE